MLPLTRHWWRLPAATRHPRTAPDCSLPGGGERDRGCAPEKIGGLVVAPPLCAPPPVAGLVPILRDIAAALDQVGKKHFPRCCGHTTNRGPLLRCRRLDRTGHNSFGCEV